MIRDDTGSVHLVYVEKKDEKQAVLDALQEKEESRRATVIVLPASPCRAFHSPKDFHDLKLCKRQGRRAILFVSASSRLAQWAKMNGFVVSASLDTLINPAKAKQPAKSSPHHVVESPFSVTGRGKRPSLPLPSMAPVPVQAPPKEMSPWQDAEQGEERSRHGPGASLLVPPFPQKMRTILLFCIIAAIVGGILWSGLLFLPRGGKDHQQAAMPPVSVVGHLSFLSSGQVDQKGNKGINDIVMMSLTHVAQAASDKSYYAWLRSDMNNSDGPVVFLGRLVVSRQGNAQLRYVDAQHNNLLKTMSRLLITEENAARVPTVPSPDQATWRYEGMIVQTPDPKDQQHQSFLSHVRHLLASEPMLKEKGLHGGLMFWFYKNTGKLLKWAKIAQDEGGNAAKTSDIRQQTIHMLDYLDGTARVATDVPGNTPILVDPMEGSIGLLQTASDQSQPAYIEHIGSHLQGLLASPGIAARQREAIWPISAALNAVRDRLENARQDAIALVKMSDTQVQSQQGLLLLNDLEIQINAAYAGTINPQTMMEQHGLVWIEAMMHNLATIDVHVAAR